MFGLDDDDDVIVSAVFIVKRIDVWPLLQCDAE